MMLLKCRLIRTPKINKYAKISEHGFVVSQLRTSNIEHKGEVYLTIRSNHVA